MKEPVLVIIKPDGIDKGLVPNVLRKFNIPELEIVAMRVARATRFQAEQHYQHLKDKPFFEQIVNYLMGNFHKLKTIMIVVYYGKGAIKKCRNIAGATNPEEADPTSIRGAYGRITTKGVFENVVHVSSNKEEAEREIKLWFPPDEVMVKLYKTKIANIGKKRVWS